MAGLPSKLRHGMHEEGFRIARVIPGFFDAANQMLVKKELQDRT